jgi:hypothetical protein
LSSIEKDKKSREKEIAELIEAESARMGESPKTLVLD